MLHSSPSATGLAISKCLLVHSEQKLHTPNQLAHDTNLQLHALAGQVRRHFFRCIAFEPVQLAVQIFYMLPCLFCDCWSSMVAP